MTGGTPRARTHEALDRGLWGRPVEIAEGRAVVALDTTPGMAADDRGLVHGGVVFGLADHAAMLAVNSPTVVLAAAEMSFRAPVSVGDSLVAEARRTSAEGRRQTIVAVVRRGDEEVARGVFQTATPSRHVLDR